LTKKWIGLHFGRFFSQTHPVTLPAADLDEKMDRKKYFLCIRIQLLLWIKKKYLQQFFLNGGSVLTEPGKVLLLQPWWHGAVVIALAR
jgi:hypothetical protein